MHWQWLGLENYRDIHREHSTQTVINPSGPRFPLGKSEAPNSTLRTCVVLLGSASSVAVKYASVLGVEHSEWLP